MIKLITLNLGKGDLQTGFPQVKVSLSDGLSSPQWQGQSYLPPSPDLATTYQRWQLLYNALIRRLNLSPRIEITQGALTQVSEVDFQELSHQLKIQINKWLNSQAFLQNIEKPLYKKLLETDQINVILQTDNLTIKQMPWNLWDFFTYFPKAEIALSAPQFESPPPSLKRAGKVRILTILGDATGIDIKQDQAILKKLPNVELVILAEPSRQALDEVLRDTNGWDLLFFAGHSSTKEEVGRFSINSRESLSISQLRNALKMAIDRGLQLAIFNGCEGIGLTQELAELRIPQIIVMSQIVPDQVAYKFLKYFLPTFAQGESFYLAVRQARERLQALEKDYPCASWLPVIVQNPSRLPPTWEILAGHPPIQHKLFTSLAVSFISTALILGIRGLGALQGIELNAFDYLMRSRPPEPIDQRILVITVDDADIETQIAQGMQGKGSLFDKTLDKLLQKITPYYPRLVASDILHDFPYDGALNARLQQYPNFIGICRVGAENLTSVASPPRLPLNQVGFSNFPQDQDGVIRRQLLGMSPGQKCPTTRSLSLQVALCYLASVEGLSCPPPENYWPFIALESKKVTFQAAGYQMNPDEARGYQLLANYRSAQFASISLTKILQETQTSRLQRLIKDRLILIGMNSPKNDRHLTTVLEMSGVMIHAHAASQLINYHLEKRPLMQWWGQWGEMLWIGLWAIAGSIILIWPGKINPILCLLGISGLGSVLYAICYLFLLQGFWIPLLPAVMALVMAAGGTLWFYKTR